MWNEDLIQKSKSKQYRSFRHDANLFCVVIKLFRWVGGNALEGVRLAEKKSG